MSRVRANKFVKNLTENIASEHPVSMNKVVESSGYAVSYQRNPKKLLKTKDVMEALAKVGINADTLASEWNKVLEAEPKGEISWDSKIKGLAHISRYVYDADKSKFNPQVAFINKFINLKSLKQNSPKVIQDRRVPEEI
jgi:hypothetical protein